MLRRFATSEMKNKEKKLRKRCLGIKDRATKVGKGFLVKYVKLTIDDKIS